MKSLTKRNLLEMMRDPISLIFCVLFPLVMLVFMSLLLKNMGNVPPNFEIKNYACGICVFGYTFLTLYVAIQISSDKNTSFIKRIKISPTSNFSYLFSFFISGMVVALAQTILFFIVALIFGFPFDGNFFLSILYGMISASFYVVAGIFVGVVCSNEKQTGPISSIFISLTSILGGVFMPVSTFTGGFSTFVNILPFVHTVNLMSDLQTLGAGCIYPHILWVLGYTLLLTVLIAIIEKYRARK